MSDDFPAPGGSPRAELPAPPAAPAIRRRVHLTRLQWIGVPVLVAVPVLTLCGVFGERAGHAAAVSPSLALHVEYPARFRYRQLMALHAIVRNTSGRRLDTITVAFDTAYITRFSSVRFDPAPRTAFTVPLVDVAPGETRLVSAELWGEQYGRHPGRVVASATGTHDSAAVSFTTLVFP